MDEERLIGLVQKYTFLYDLSHPKYMDSAKKDVAWKEISEELRQPAATCKVKWQSLRDSYRRALNKRKTTSGQSTRKKIKKWKYENEMSFLKPCFSGRKSVNSVLEISMDEEFSESGGEQTPNAEEFPAGVRASLPTTGESGVDSSCNSERTVVGSPSSAVKKNPPDEGTAALSVLMTYLLEEKTSKNNLSSVDELDRFFLSISETVKKFSPYEQAVAKSKVFSVISSMEINRLHHTSTSINSPTGRSNDS